MSMADRNRRTPLFAAQNPIWIEDTGEGEGGDPDIQVITDLSGLALDDDAPRVLDEQLPADIRNSPWFIHHDTLPLDEGFTIRVGFAFRRKNNNDLIFITNIIEDARTETFVIRGIQLRRCTELDDWLGAKFNDLCIICHHTTIEQDYEVQALLPLIKGCRKVTFTNCKDSSRPDVNDLELCCRWKYVCRRESPSGSGSREKIIEESLELLTEAECTRGYGVPDATLRYRNQRPRRQNSQLTKPRQTVHHRSRPNEYNVCDAFCGAGFASRAAEGAGLTVGVAFDKDSEVIVSYRDNHPTVRALNVDAYTFIERYAAGLADQIDVLHVSPPCQPFSPAHTREGWNDDNNTDALLTLKRFVEVLRPRVITLEETFGLKSAKKHQAYFRNLIHDITSSYYSIRWTELNGAEYGAPQQRRRLYMFASAPGEALPQFPMKTHNKDRRNLNRRLRPCVTIRKALRRVQRGHANHDPRRRLYRYSRRRPRAPPSWDDQLKHCITTKGGDLNHPDGMRTFTPHELILLNGGDPFYTLRGPTTSCYRYVGNGVQTVVMRKLFRAVRDSLAQTDQRQATNDGNAEEFHRENRTTRRAMPDLARLTLSPTPATRAAHSSTATISSSGAQRSVANVSSGSLRPSTFTMLNGRAGPSGAKTRSPGRGRDRDDFDAHFWGYFPGAMQQPPTSTSRLPGTTMSNSRAPPFPATAPGSRALPLAVPTTSTRSQPSAVTTSRSGAQPVVAPATLQRQSRSRVEAAAVPHANVDRQIHNPGACRDDPMVID